MNKSPYLITGNHSPSPGSGSASSIGSTSHHLPPSSTSPKKSDVTRCKINNRSCIYYFNPKFYLSLLLFVVLIYHFINSITDFFYLFECASYYLVDFKKLITHNFSHEPLTLQNPS